eukprot:6511502-Prymnesium_polylepis.1
MAGARSVDAAPPERRRVRRQPRVQPCAPPLSSTQELPTGPAVPSCSPPSLPRPPESASPAPAAAS